MSSTDISKSRIVAENIGSICSAAVHPILNKAGVCLLTRRKSYDNARRCDVSLLDHAVQTEIYSPCVKMLSARWGSQVIPAGS